MILIEGNQKCSQEEIKKILTDNGIQFLSKTSKGTDYSQALKEALKENITELNIKELTPRVEMLILMAEDPALVAEMEELGDDEETAYNAEIEVTYTKQKPDDYESSYRTEMSFDIDIQETMEETCEEYEQIEEYIEQCFYGIDATHMNFEDEESFIVKKPIKTKTYKI